MWYFLTELAKKIFLSVDSEIFLSPRMSVSEDLKGVKYSLQVVKYSLQVSQICCIFDCFEIRKLVAVKY